MLVLDRHVSERIVVTHGPSGDRFEIALVRVRGDKAGFGFEAGREFGIHRAEVQSKIDAQHRAEREPPRAA